MITLPAELNLLFKLGVLGLRSLLQLADVEKGEGVVDKAMQSPVVTIGVLIHQAGDEVGGDGDDESLGVEAEAPENSQDRHRPDGTGPAR